LSVFLCIILIELHETSTLRRCAAYTLDELGKTYREKVFAIVSPIIDGLLQQESWVLKYINFWDIE